MKTKLLLVVLLLLSAVSIPAQEEPGFTPPWRAPVPDVEEGATLIAVGFWGDVVGIGLMAGASAGFSLDFTVGAALFQTGLISMLFVGNPCLQVGMQQHHDAIEARGFDVSEEFRDKSRLFSFISLGCAGGSLALSLVALSADSMGLGIGSIVLGAVGAGFEIVNFYNFRRNWGLDMKAAAGIEP